MNRGEIKYVSDEEKRRNREKVLYRAKNEVRRLINANVGKFYDEKKRAYKPVFLTLTFKRNEKDIKIANSEFRKFIKRFGTYVGGKESHIKYVAVPEFQKRGAVHYHLAIFNLPYTEATIIAKIWSHGNIDIISMKEVDNVGAYMSKYMTKNAADVKKNRLAGNKSYFRSRDLFEPIELRFMSDFNVDLFELCYENEVCHENDLYYKNEVCCRIKHVNEYESEYYGRIKYEQFIVEENFLKESIYKWQEILESQSKLQRI